MLHLYVKILLSYQVVHPPPQRRHTPVTISVTPFSGSPHLIPRKTQHAAHALAQNCQINLSQTTFPGGSVGKESACNAGGSLPDPGIKPRVSRRIICIASLY